MNRSGIRTAFLLGAGLGTRLRPLTETCPKPLLPVGGRPIITYAMDHLRTAGIERFIVNTHHCADAYQRAFPDACWRGVPVIFRHEPVLLDTAGGLKNIEDLLGGDEAVIVYNADVLTDLPLAPLFEAYAGRRREVMLVLRSAGPLPNVALDEAGEICDIRGLLGRPGVRKCQFAGIYIVETKFLDRLTAGHVESVVPVFVRMIREHPGSVGYALIDRGEWRDIGSPGQYREVAAAPPVHESAPAGPAESVRPGPADNEQAQPFESIEEATVMSYVRRVLQCAEAAILRITPLAKGGSDRTFRRVHLRGGPPVIFMHYNPLRQENRYYADIAAFLTDIGVSVPRILDHDARRCFVLMQDLGEADLWSFRHAAWPVRRALYRRVLKIVRRLHAYPVEGLAERSLTLMPGFGPELYRWERDYFCENFIRGVCGMKPAPAEARALETELGMLAERLGQTGISLIHRDLQSQNIMLREGNPALIDFQGMRTGSAFYDLASLLYDPYVPMHEKQRMGLLRYYFNLQQMNPDWEGFRRCFHEAAVQRLMQALGAFAFLGRRFGRNDFLAHIPSGLERLGEALSHCPELPALGGLVHRCRPAV